MEAIETTTSTTDQPVWLQRMNYYLDDAANEERLAAESTDPAQARIHQILARESRIFGNKIGRGKR